MNRTISGLRKGVRLSVGVALLMLASAGTSLAQPKAEPAGPPLMDVTMVRVKPDMVGEFNAFIKNDYKPALVKGGVKNMWVWRTAGFGDAFLYVFVSPIARMAEFDAPGPVEKGVGSENMASFFKRAGTMVTSVHSYTMIERQDLSHVSPTFTQPKMAVIVTMKATAGRQSDFEGYLLNEFMPAFKKSDAKGMLVHQTVFGGDPHEYVMLVPIDNFAELDKGHPVARAIGLDAWKKLRDRMPGAVSDIAIMRFNDTLSITSAPQK